MSSKLDDVLAFIGFVSLLAGIYLWLGLPATLIVFGATLIYIGVRVNLAPKVVQNEPDQTTVL
jgi:hypothetical protein